MGLERVTTNSTWGNIIRVEKQFEKNGLHWVESFGRVVGNGEKTEFWKDIWVDRIRMCDRFPRLFKLEKKSRVV